MEMKRAHNYLNNASKSHFLILIIIILRIPYKAIHNSQQPSPEKV